MISNLKMNVIYNILTTVLITLLQLVILIVISKFDSTESVGLLTLGLAITAPILLLSRLNLRSAYNSDYLNEFTFNQYHTLRIMFTVLYILLSFIVIQFFSLPFKDECFIYSIVIWKAIESISDMIYAYFQKKTNMRVVFYINLWKVTLTIILFMMTYFIFEDIVLAFMSLITIHLLFLVIEYRKLNKYIDFKLMKNFDTKKLLALTIPLGVAHFLTSMNVNVPRYSLQYIGNAEQLGVYGSLFYLITAGTYIIIAINNAVLPGQSEMRHKLGFREVKKLNQKLNMLIFLLVLPIFVTSLLYGDLIIGIIFNEKIASYKKEFIFVILIALIQYLNINLENVYLTYQLYKAQMRFNLFYFMIIAPLSFILTLYQGIFGAILAVLITELVMYVIKLIFINRKVGDYT